MHAKVSCTFALLLLLGLQRTDASHWSYPDRDLDEVFPSWGGICDTGTLQSPIDLSITKSLKGVFDELKLDNFEDKQSGVTVVNNGHSIQLANFNNEMEVEGGPLRDEYVVEQVHLHWWSEHTINNVRYPLEAHIVSRNKRYANVTMASNFKDGLTVIAVLYHVSNERNEAIDQIVDYLDDVKDFDKINEPVRMKNPFVVRQLFPKLNGYMTYSGSLTTPSCAEAVTWIVLSETFPVTLEQVDNFKQIQNEEKITLKNNYRDLQKANNRPVIVVLPLDKSVSDAASPLQLSMGTLFFMLIAAKLL
ncbi:putative carbonic anhydrase 3 isoform X1 [Bactrocera dorsalis]|uniref:Carbonic anhydrase n=1 Tax=Bactrocera dorsalis TaxID=27457 RepID=A0A6I9VIN9_BACDO|nr:putative carbonic anhydrase 3 isoform X1 [Bactrocera dorsalis]